MRGLIDTAASVEVAARGAKRRQVPMAAATRALSRRSHRRHRRRLRVGGARSFRNLTPIASSESRCCPAACSPHFALKSTPPPNACWRVLVWRSSSPPAQAAVGALVHHLGREHDSMRQAKQDIDAWTREIDSRGLGRDHRHRLRLRDDAEGLRIHFPRADDEYAAKAARVSHIARDISEVLAELMKEPSVAGRLGAGVSAPGASSVTLGRSHRCGWRTTPPARSSTARNSTPSRQLFCATPASPCSTCPEGHICCGSAGTYSMLQPEMSAKLRDRKARNIETDETRCHRHWQHRVHHADFTGDGCSHRSHRRAARLRPPVARRRHSWSARQGIVMGLDTVEIVLAIEEEFRYAFRHSERSRRHPRHCRKSSSDYVTIASGAIPGRTLRPSRSRCTLGTREEPSSSSNWGSSRT